MTATGVLLAAGAGTRMGRPKALVRDAAGVPWLENAARVLRAGGCDDVVVVLGAAADQARSLVPGDLGAVDVVVAHDWERGMGASLRTGLARLAGTGAEMALVHLVDLPDVGAEVVARVLAEGGTGGAAALARASYDGSPGHPVLLGRDHWPGVAATALGDRGARDYLAAHGCALVECGDLAGGADVDRPEGGAAPTGDQRTTP
ncbi:nucleotidyltransferase family protein [Nocardioides sp. zg-536]|uniref:Nucleotidyltransferase family protein n=1 Tax=Nocardioides faecalis TaxID=2803858 RepID=A0A939BV05_9ACTN|nr:nucleotidyltransferase family protein [Nocardioides faecalis]MBM9459431.1 nucleotidyltransferase family protein [Nocardioides faecalis]MBS4751672.1 nucleotidyltransferase family protein [Nocardioides faecalis]QVI59462.1 nucleotidyltransferase family protein [Nocardioides faecalis]